MVDESRFRLSAAQLDKCLASADANFEEIAAETRNPYQDMIGRVARAIAAALADAYSEREEPTEEDHEKAARAAIEAMRDPTDTMLDSGWNELPGFNDEKGNYEPANAVLTAIWQRMVDHCLGIQWDVEKPPVFRKFES